MPRLRAYSATRPGQEPPWTAEPYSVSHNTNVHSGRLTCIPTIPMLHCTQLPSGLRNHARYSAGSSIAAACSPAGDAADTVESPVLENITAITAAAKPSRLQVIEPSFLPSCGNAMRAG